MTPGIRGQGFDPRTFTRAGAARPGAYSLPPEEDGKTRKSSYHRLNFGARTEEENLLNTTYDRGLGEGGNATFDVGEKLNSTFNKTSEMMTDNHHNELNATYDRNTSLSGDTGLNSTFTRNGQGVGGGGGHNATFERGGTNATFNRGEIPPGGVLNATFEKDGGAINGGGAVNGGGASHRKMSEDRLSSASSRYNKTFDMAYPDILSKALIIVCT